MREKNTDRERQTETYGVREKRTDRERERERQTETFSRTGLALAQVCSGGQVVSPSALLAYVIK